jgi:hypothetical protein
LVAFNAWSLNYAISELLTAYFNVEAQDLVMLDRGPFDSLAWMAHLRDDGKLTAADYDKIKAFALLGKWMGTISKVFLFTCRVDVSLSRENNSKLTPRTGRAMNPETLGKLLTQYETLGENFREHPIKRIDTSDTQGPLGTSCEIAGEILDLIEALRVSSV